MKHAVLTGATGAIGTALIRCLVEKSIRVTVIHNPSSVRNRNIALSPYVNTVFCDMNNYGELNLPEDNYDVFFHLAWQGTTGDGRNNEELQKLNLSASLQAVRLAKRCGCKRFIGLGSQAEFGRKNVPLDSMLSCNPETFYGKYKLKAGIETKDLCNTLGLEHNWVRVLSVFGPNESENSLVSSSINKLLNNLSPEYTKGEQIWDFLYSDDAATALFLIAENGKSNKTYILGSGEGKPLSEYITDIHNVVNPQIKPQLGKIPYNEKQIMYLVADISELTEDTGFIPQIKFRDGIRKMIGLSGE